MFFSCIGTFEVALWRLEELSGALQKSADEK